jgi:CelD/BcsL family acetyltransferase involved in cellulose biosynthesis
MAAAHALMKAAMQTVLVSDLDPTLEDASVRGARITVYASLAEAERVWREAVAGCACYVFQTFEWNSVWKNTIGSTQRVAERVVHVAAADERTLMLLPLGIYQHRYFTSLQFLGGDATDYNAPVIDRAFASAVSANGFAKLWRIIIGLMPRFDLVYLARMPKTIEETPNPMLYLPAVRRSETAFAATLPASFADFTAARSTDFFRQNRYNWRRLAKLGAVEVRFPSDQTERDEIVQVAAAQKTEWLTHYGLPNLFGRPEVREFYKRLTNVPFETGDIVVASLRVGQRIVATMWGPRFRSRYCFLLSSYDSEWSQFSVGRLLMESVVQWCIAQRDVKVFDLTVGHEAYKLHWSDHVLPLHQQLDARTLKGAAVAAYRHARAQLANYDQVRNLVHAVRRAFRARPGFAGRRA